jgi:hypothetical protein
MKTLLFVGARFTCAGVIMIVLAGGVLRVVGALSGLGPGHAPGCPSFASRGASLTRQSPRPIGRESGWC